MERGKGGECRQANNTILATLIGTLPANEVEKPELCLDSHHEIVTDVAVSYTEGAQRRNAFFY